MSSHKLGWVGWNVLRFFGDLCSGLFFGGCNFQKWWISVAATVAILKECLDHQGRGSEELNLYFLKKLQLVNRKPRGWPTITAIANSYHMYIYIYTSVYVICMFIDLISISILLLASSLKRRVETPKFKVSSANWRLAGHGWLVAATTDRIQQILRISQGLLVEAAFRPANSGPRWWRFFSDSL